MALSTRLIKTKIRSVQNIRKITRAMEMVAASKMRKAIAQATASREYTEHAVNLLTRLAGDSRAVHPLLAKPRAEKKFLVIVVMSDKGLCGGFNVILSKAVTRFCEQHADHEIELVAVGRYAERTARRLNKNVVGSFYQLPDNISSTDAGAIAKLVQDEFLAGNYRRVYIIYNHFVSALSFKPVARRILPISLAAAQNALEALGAEVIAPPKFNDEYLFEPSVTEVLDIVLPRLFEVMVFQSLLESRASEYSARMFAMKNASDNARDLIDDLTLSYNHARQDSITQELSEIVAGANALSQ